MTLWKTIIQLDPKDEKRVWINVTTYSMQLQEGVFHLVSVMCFKCLHLKLFLHVWSINNGKALYDRSIHVLVVLLEFETCFEEVL